MGRGGRSRILLVAIPGWPPQYPGRSSDRIGGVGPNLLPISVKTPCAESGRNTRRGSLPRAGATLHVRIGQAGLRPILAGTSWPPNSFFRITTSDA
jgi:hypothetical protein